MKLTYKIIRNSVFGILGIIAFNLGILYFLGFPEVVLFQIKRYFILLLLLIIWFWVQIGLFTYIKHKNSVYSGTIGVSEVLLQ